MCWKSFWMGCCWIFDCVPSCRRWSCGLSLTIVLFLPSNSLKHFFPIIFSTCSWSCGRLPCLCALLMTLLEWLIESSMLLFEASYVTSGSCLYWYVWVITFFPGDTSLLVTASQLLCISLHSLLEVLLERRSHTSHLWLWSLHLVFGFPQVFLCSSRRNLASLCESVFE